MWRGIKGTAYIRFDSRKCNACWKCVDACSANVFDKINVFVHKHAKIVHQERCTGCLECARACDYGAIDPVIESAG